MKFITTAVVAATSATFILGSAQAEAGDGRNLAVVCDNVSACEGYQGCTIDNSNCKCKNGKCRRKKLDCKLKGTQKQIENWSCPTDKECVARKENGRWGRCRAPETETCDDNGYETLQQRPNEDVSLKLDTKVDTSTCTYELSLSFMPDPELPLLSGPTADSLLGMEEEAYRAICDAEGFNEQVKPSVLSAENHVGLNEHYTEYAYGIELSERAAASVGFKLASLGSGPCGSFLQPFPQYSVHFYTIDTEKREQMRCVTEGGYFCKSYENQCSDSGRRFNMNGVGLPTCPDAPPGPPQFQDLPRGFFWTIDGGAIGVNAANPSMGLHAVDPSEFAQNRNPKVPYTLFLNYDEEVNANHVLIWAGLARGEAPELLPYTKETPVYNCKSDDKKFLPTGTVVDYDDATKRTSITITGPLLDCSGDSYEEVQN